MNGFLLIHKPAGITSYDCIRHIKRIIGKQHKIGHAGTLDPFASGLIIIGISRSATKQLSTFMQRDKTYIATGKLNELTSTFDPEGDVIKTTHASVTKTKLCDAFKDFIGNYTHVPPLYSALKYKGQPLYKLARTKQLSDEECAIICQQKQRTTTIYNLDLVSFDFPCFTIRVHVSHGTYIRSLVNNIAQRVGSVATTTALQRTAIGNHHLKDAYNLYDLRTGKDIEDALHTLKNT